MLDVFKDVVFKRKVKKHISSSTGYSGIVGQKSSRPQEQHKVDEGWGTVDPPADTDALEWQLSQAMDTLKMTPVTQSDQTQDQGQSGTIDGDDSDGEPEGFSKESENEVQELATSFISTVQEKTQGKHWVPS